MKHSACVNLKETDLLTPEPFSDGNPREKGFAVPVHYDHKDSHERIVDFLIFHARLNLNPGEVFEIRGVATPWEGKGEFGRTCKTREERASAWGLAWYWSSGNEEERGFFIKREPLFRTPVSEAEDDKDLGCLIIARVKA